MKIKNQQIIQCKFIKYNLRINYSSNEIQKIKKLSKKQTEAYESKIKIVNEKINLLQISLENSKTELAYEHKTRKILANDKEEREKDLSSINELYDMKKDKFND